MALDKQQVHRPGALKQTNKGHKHGQHRSKGALNIAQKGKVNLKTFSKKKKGDLRKEQRRHQSLQIRKNKRDEVLNKKRAIGGIDGIPFLVCVLPLNENINPEITVKFLSECDPDASVNKSKSGVVHVSVPRFKQRFAFIVPTLDNNLAILDTLKVCDSVLFLVSASAETEFGTEFVDKWGTDLLVSAFAQGLPTPSVGILDMQKIAVKKQNEQKQNIQKLVSKWLPDEKPVVLDKDMDGINILRKIGNQKRRSVIYRDRRPHLYAENYEYVKDSEGIEGTLKVTGYLRGAILSANDLIYMPGLGDFQISQIDAPHDPFISQKKRNTASEEIEDGTHLIRVLERADPAKQESLQSENIPDPMNAEQTWPTEEEIKMAQEENKQAKKVKKVPKGWSDYQSAWIPDDEAEELSEDDEDGEDEEGEDYMEAMSEESESGEEEEFETVTQSEIGVNDQQYDQQTDFTTENEELQKIKEANLDKMFPDEIDTPKDVPARERFQKYRGLESFRTTPWDPKENLPSDYARIFQFQNFDRTKKRVFKDLDLKEGALVGWYITVHIKGVSQLLWRAFETTSAPVILIGMFPHEHKMSVLNVVLKHAGYYDQPIKSKERLIFQCGYRRFIVNPVFSQHTNGAKHKYERYFQPDSTIVATFFAPIQFPPAPVICYKEQNGRLNIVATGSLLSCNPDRIVAKRIVLSGHPFKVHKRSAVVRFMFFNREDIIYFKPVKLRTKHGRTGHIKEPLGTHGHMKCVFDGQLKSQDTILLHLYKRVFPKWTYEECIVSCESLQNDDEMEA